MRKNRDSRRTLIATCLLLLSVAGLAPAFAQDSDSDPAAPPLGYRIETISVEGVERDAARNIVAGETRLREGSTYDETALERAVYRVKRLPFVLDAAYELREGSAPGAYELVVTVQTYSPVTVQADGFGAYDGDSFRGEDRFDASAAGEVAARAFVGGQGMAFGSVQQFEGGDPFAELGYRQYGLFGRGSSAALTVGRRFSDDDVESTQARLVVALPISPNNTLRAVYDWSRTDFDFGFGEARLTSQGPSLQWVYDTTDDPLLTLRGTQVTGGGAYYTEDDHFPDFESGNFNNLFLNVFGRQYVPLTARQSLGFGLGATYSEVEAGDTYIPNVYTYTAEVGHFANLWRSERPGSPGDLRLENRVQYFEQDTDVSLLEPVDGDGSLALSSGLVFRNRWAILRATLSYVDDL